MADKNFKVKNNIIINDVEIDPSSPAQYEVLKYDGTKFISDVSGVPSAGLEGQILSKVSDTSFDTQWIDNFADQLRVIAKNGTLSQINKGTAVMAVGAVGDRIEIEPAVSDGSVEVKYMLGIATENIAVDSEGYVTLVGAITGLNTNSYAVGTILYLDPSTPGALTSTEPTAPDIDLAAAIVIKQNVSSGIIFVRMWTQGAKIGELQDVNTTGVTDGQVLVYDSTTSTWLPETPSGGGGSSYPSNINAQTGTTYGIVSTDDTKVVSLSNSSPITVTLSVGSWRDAASIYLVQTGTGQITVNANTGVTINYSMMPKTRTQYSALSLIHFGSNTWLLTGDMPVS